MHSKQFAADDHPQTGHSILLSRSRQGNGGKKEVVSVLKKGNVNLRFIYTKAKAKAKATSLLVGS